MEVRFGNATAIPGQRVTGKLSVGELDQLSFARGAIEIPLIVVNGAVPGPTLLILAGCHSGEYVGIEATIEVTKRIDPAQLKGILVAIPVLNIHGFAAKIPYVNPLDNLNINRLWPGDSGGTVGQRITYAVWHEVISRVDYVIDMHGGDFPEDQADYAICIEAGDPASDRMSERMARYYGLPYVRKSPPAEGMAPTGSTARMAMKLLKKPSIVSEVGDAGRVDPERLCRDVFGVENVMRLLQMLPGPPISPPEHQRLMIDRRSVLANAHGLCRARVKVYDVVTSGQPVADIVDYYGEVRETLVTPIDGIVAQLFYQGATNPGNIVMKIGKIAD